MVVASGCGVNVRGRRVFESRRVHIELTQLAAPFCMKRTGSDFHFQMDVIGAKYRVVRGVCSCRVAVQTGARFMFYLGLKKRVGNM